MTSSFISYCCCCCSFIMDCMAVHSVCCCCLGCACFMYCWTIGASIDCCIIGTIMTDCIKLFVCHIGANACWTVPLTIVLACVNPLRPLLDWTTVQLLFLGLSSVPTCVAVLQIWLGQAWLQLFELWPLPQTHMKQYMIPLLL